MTNTGFYAISNDLGAVPAYYRLREGNKTYPLPDHIDASATSMPSVAEVSTLEKRLPSYVTIYARDDCASSSYLGTIINPRSGQCYGEFFNQAPQSLYIPSSLPGDIFNIYYDQSCQNYQNQLYQYRGCFTPNGNFNSIWPCNVCG
jgi:hypothetical protein